MIGCVLCVSAPLITQLFEPMSVSTIRPTFARCASAGKPLSLAGPPPAAARGAARYAAATSPGANSIGSRNAS